MAVLLKKRDNYTELGDIMTIGVIGTRNVTGVSLELFSKYIPNNCTLIISGGARGVDRIAKEYANENGIPIREILPDYDFFGRKAPIVRNTTIVKSVDKVVAFWDYRSRGTAHAIRECIRLDVPVKIIAISDIMGD